MKKLYVVLISVGTLVIGLFIGYLTGSNSGFKSGYDSGYRMRNVEQETKPYSELISEISQKEASDIVQFIEVSSELKKIDEGGLFKIDYNHYLSGSIKNRSVATRIKDIKIKVDYFSQTKSVISSEEITVYQSVNPLQSVSFNEKISPPDKTTSYNYSVIDAKTY